MHIIKAVWQQAAFFNADKPEPTVPVSRGTPVRVKKSGYPYCINESLIIFIK